MAVICGAFGVTPRQALLDLDEEPEGLSFRVLEARAFARAVELVEANADDPQQAEFDADDELQALAKELWDEWGVEQRARLRALRQAGVPWH